MCRLHGWKFNEVKRNFSKNFFIRSLEEEEGKTITFFDKIEYQRNEFFLDENIAYINFENV